MREIERVGLPQDLSVGQGAQEAKFYFAPKEGELSASGLGTQEWQWVIIEGRFVLIQRV